MAVKAKTKAAIHLDKLQSPQLALVMIRVEQLSIGTNVLSLSKIISRLR